MTDFCNNCTDFLNWRKDLEEKLKAADALAKATKVMKACVEYNHQQCNREMTEALAAYEKLRGLEGE